jgi:peptidoglycan hydrolase CwlO-like protein
LIYVYLSLQELADAIQRLDELKAVSVSHEHRADRAVVEAQAAEERHHRSLEQLKRDHEGQMSEVVAQLQDAKQQLSQLVNVCPGLVALATSSQFVRAKAEDCMCQLWQC